VCLSEQIPGDTTPFKMIESNASGFVTKFAPMPAGALVVMATPT